MKKILALILVITIILTFAACGKKATDEVEDPETQIEEVTPDTEDDKTEESEATDDKTEVKPGGEQDKKPVSKPVETEKPQAGTTKPVAKPEVKPEAKPETTPEAKPEVKPEASTPATLGNTLLADFKTKASGSDVVAIAESLLQNPAIKFGGGAMPVEPGLLSGFDKTTCLSCFISSFSHM